MRLQPIEGVRLIAEDHIEIQGLSSAVTPIVPILFPTPGDFDFTTSTFYDTTNDSIVDYNLSDIALSVATLVWRKPIFTSSIHLPASSDLVGNGNFDVRDIDFRPNGTLAGFDRTLEARPPANTDADTLTDYFTIDAGTGTFTDAGDFGLQTSHIEFSNAVPPVPTVVASDDGFNIEAMTFAIIGGQEQGIAVGNRPTPPAKNLLIPSLDLSTPTTLASPARAVRPELLHQCDLRV